MDENLMANTEATRTSCENESSPFYFGWFIVLGAVIGLMFSPGPMILLLVGNMAPLFEQTHGWSTGQVMFGLTLFGVASLIAAPLAGAMADRFGVRKVMLPSILAAAACLSGFGAVASRLWEFYLLCFLFGLLGYGAQSLTYNKLLTEWFDEQRGLAIGTASAGLGLGYVVLPGIIGLAVPRYGANGTFYLMAAIVVVLPFAVNFFSAVSPAGRFQRRTGGMVAGSSLGEAVKTRTFWLLALAILIISAVVTGVVPQLSKLARDMGYSTGTITTVSAGFGVVTLCVRIFIGWLLDRAFAPRIGALAFLLSGAGCFLVAACVYGVLPVAAFGVGVALVGVGYGTESDLISYLTSKYFGKRHFGKIYGCLIILFLCGVSVGPLMYGTARSVLGTYGHVFVVAAALAVMSAIAMLCLPRYAQGERLR